MTALCYHVAIVGAGPSGFYAAEALLRSDKDIAVDLFERLPVPYGLVRFGVAPDHPKLKQVTAVFERIAQMPGFRFIGGVEIGADIRLDDLRRCYHAVILATGAALGREIGLPGENLPGTHQASDFVGWYNGHPDYRDLTFDFGGERAVVIGHGNVALDVARILVRTPDELRHCRACSGGAGGKPYSRGASGGAERSGRDALLGQGTAGIRRT
ncbi:FAD-dependent oxidoreductase (plasmid) [Rhizobium leguminosarum]